jgi:hypothetical protein
MRNEIDQRLILEAFEKVHEYGKAEDGKHTLDGITVYTDHDGYTVFLEGHGVRMTLEFHNKYHLDYEHQRQLDQFLRALENIVNGKYESTREKP